MFAAEEGKEKDPRDDHVFIGAPPLGRINFFFFFDSVPITLRHNIGTH